MKGTIRTPEGTQDRLFSQCRERRQIQKSLLGLFQRRGYDEVSTPEVEFYDLFPQSGNPMPQEQLLKIIDRDGKIMVMRPDSTTPIARVAATKLKNRPNPQRLFYDQTVFRSGLQHRGGRSEIVQCGVELLGAKGLRADVEILAMAADSLRECVLPQFHIEVGHVGFFHDLTRALGLPKEETETIRTLIEEKNFAALGDFLSPYADTVPGKALDRLPYLFGGVEVLDEAEALFSDTAAISHLRAVYNELSAAGYGDCFRFDLGLVHQIDYYTGVVFRGYAEGAADAVLSGGRYDKLLSAFGPDTPATGFAVDVDAVAACMPLPEGCPPNILVFYGPGYFARAMDYVEDAPFGDMELCACDTVEEAKEIARAKGARWVHVIDDNGERRMPCG